MGHLALEVGVGTPSARGTHLASDSDSCANHHTIERGAAPTTCRCRDDRHPLQKPGHLGTDVYSHAVLAGPRDHPLVWWSVLVTEGTC